jgi:hypothetical protein
MCRIEQSQLKYRALAYLVEHPDAQDTLEGIIEWWLVEQEIKHQTAAVKEVLAELVNKELVIEHQEIDSRSHYRINRQKSREIRALLKQGFV